MSKIDLTKGRYLLACIILLVAVILVLLFRSIYSPGDLNWLESISISVISGLLSTSIVFLAFYWFIERAGLSELSPTKSISENKDHHQEQEKDITFFPDFSQVDWENIITRSSKIDIIVCYFDSWVNHNRTRLRNFFENGGEIRVFLGNPEHEDTLKETIRRFPDRTPEQVKEKIQNTYSRIKSIRDEVKNGNVEGFLLDSPINYSAIIIDDRYVLLSIYEQFRSDHIASSAILIDKNAWQETRDFWKKEIMGFEKDSNRIL